MKEELLKRAQGLQKALVSHRRALHKYAEIGFDVPKTKKYIREQLEKLGYQPQDCGMAGLVATIEGKGEGARKKTAFLLRADMDALPMQERSEEPFACTTGRMHACGHDMHAAMLLGAAALLKNCEKEFSGTIKLMFQPAEERLEGAKNMISAGVLRSPKVDGAMMLHVATGVDLPTGTLIAPMGGVSAPAADYFTVFVQGKSCHGSTPHEGSDPLNVAAHILIALQEIPAKELSLSQPAVVTVGKLSGGVAGNAIADSVAMEGTIRSYDEKVRKMIKKRIMQIANGVASAFRTKAQTTFPTGCPTFVNDPFLAAKIKENMTELFGKEQVLEIKNQGGGSEDFAYVSHETPTVLLSLAAGERAKGYAYPLHHPKARFDEGALWTGCAAYAYAALCQMGKKL